MNYTGQGDADGREIDCFNNIGSQRSHDLLWTHYNASTIGNEFYQKEDDGKNPEDIDDNLEAAELIGELVEDDCDDAGALSYEEPLGGEVPNSQVQRGQRGLLLLGHGERYGDAVTIVKALPRLNSLGGDQTSTGARVECGWCPRSKKTKQIRGNVAR